MKKELKLLKGNEALAEAIIRSGADAYFGYPITPQSDILEYLMAENATERTGMVVLQAESEIAAVNMVHGAGGCGKKAVTSSSSPGISLMVEAISYMVGAEVPCLIVNVVRGGPGLGTIQPSQCDYFQAVKGGGHGDYKTIVLAPASSQDMCDYVPLSFDLAFKYRNPVMILSDGAIGSMMEKVELFEQMPRETTEYPWATTGKTKNRERNLIFSLSLEAEGQERRNIAFQEKFRTIEKNEVRYEAINVEDAEYLLVGYGLSARLCQKVVQLYRQKGVKIGLLRPITLWPFPTKILQELAPQLKGILSVEMSAGQMIEDIRLAVNGQVRVEHYGRMGGMIASPIEVLEAFQSFFLNR